MKWSNRTQVERDAYREGFGDSLVAIGIVLLIAVILANLVK